MIVLDASALLAALDESEPAHSLVLGVLENEQPPLLLSPVILTELDYFLLRNLGLTHELAFLQEVVDGTYDLVPFGADDVARASVVIERFADLCVGLADASIVILAERYGTNRVLSLDERHFRALRTLDGRPFTLLPADV